MKDSNDRKNQVTMCKEYKLSSVETGKEISVKTINSPDEAYTAAKQFFFDDIRIYESAFIIGMHQSKPIGWAKISQGGITSTIVDTRIVCKYAIDMMATGVIFVHNHPSGNTKPSEPDKNLVKKLDASLSVLDIKLIDSIIITEDSYCSMREEGCL